MQALVGFGGAPRRRGPPAIKPTDHCRALKPNSPSRRHSTPPPTQIQGRLLERWEGESGEDAEGPSAIPERRPVLRFSPYSRRTPALTSLAGGSAAPLEGSIPIPERRPVLRFPQYSSRRSPALTSLAGGSSVPSAIKAAPLEGSISIPERRLMLRFSPYSSRQPPALISPFWPADHRHQGLVHSTTGRNAQVIVLHSTSS